MSEPVPINDPAVVAEVRAAFGRYERALVANDLDTLDALFWDSPSVVRFGFDDAEYGADEVRAFRRSLPRQTLPRTLGRTVVVALGADVAVVTTEFTPDGSTAVGRQTQTWLRSERGWVVANAHVSWLGGRGPA